MARDASQRTDRRVSERPCDFVAEGDETRPHRIRSQPATCHLFETGTDISLPTGPDDLDHRHAGTGVESVLRCSRRYLRYRPVRLKECGVARRYALLKGQRYLLWRKRRCHTMVHVPYRSVQPHCEPVLAV